MSRKTWTPFSDSPRIKDVLKRGRAINSELFFVKFLPLSAASSRFSVIAGLRVSKKAVIRNRIKRKIRELARPLVGEMKQKFFVAITIKPAAADKEPQYLKNDLTNILNKINK